MTKLTVRGWLYSLLVLLAPFAALGLGDPSPALVAVPAALVLTYGLVARTPSVPRVESALSVGRTLENTPVDLHLEVHGFGSIARVTLDLSPAIEVTGMEDARRVGAGGMVVALGEGHGRATVRMEARHWGSYRIGTGSVSVPGPLGIVAEESPFESGTELAVLPERETVRRLVEPYATNLHAGDITSRARGQGTDLAELRPWAQGDSPRAINWRASVRNDRLWITDRHADRNGDLILVIDSIVVPGSTLEAAVAQAVRIVASLVKAYGGQRHRLGLVSLSGFVRWFGLDAGSLHEHRLLAGAMATQVVAEPVWMAVDRVLDRVVRPPAMVVFVSPLFDDEFAGRMMRLARAGMDVLVLSVDVTAWLPPPGDRLQNVARRIWAMERGRRADRLRSAGIAVGEWRPGRSLEEILEEVEEWRRRARRARM